MTIVVLGLAVVLALIVVRGVASVRAGLHDIGHRAGPQVVATSDAYFALNDMDAQVANVLLVGAERNLGVGRATAMAIYERRRRQVDGDIQRAAAVGAGDAAAERSIGAVLDALGRYEALSAQAILVDGQAPHPAGRSPEAALTLYRQATDLLKTDLLPAAARLTAANSDALERAYEAKRWSARQAALGTALAGFALLGTLIWLQVLLARRYRRWMNPPALLAALTAATLAVAGVRVFVSAAEHLRVAKKDAFDSVLALSRARAVGYDANADESRYLVDPARRGWYEQAFLAKSQELATLPSATTLPDYPIALARAKDAYAGEHADIRWKGYLGTEFRNITFPGERALAERTLAAYLAYEQDDPRLRALLRQGRTRDAVRFNTGYAPGQSNYDFTRYDRSLDALIGLNRSYFAASIRAGEKDLAGWTLMPWAAMIAVIVLAAGGVAPRLAEYR